MTEVSRIKGQLWGGPIKTPVGLQAPILKAASTKQEAYREFGNRDRDGKDDVLLRARVNGNYYVLSADKIDFTGIGVGNRVQVDNIEADVLGVNNESAVKLPENGIGGEVSLTRKEKSGMFSSIQRAVQMQVAQLFTITSKKDRDALDNRIHRDGKDNVVIQDRNSENLYLITADKINFTTIGVGDLVTFGKTSGKVTRIDDEASRNPATP